MNTHQSLNDIEISNKDYKKAFNNLENNKYILSLTDHLTPAERLVLYSDYEFGKLKSKSFALKRSKSKYDLLSEMTFGQAKNSLLSGIKEAEKFIQENNLFNPRVDIYRCEFTVSGWLPVSDKKLILNIKKYVKAEIERAQLREMEQKKLVLKKITSQVKSKKEATQAVSLLKKKFKI